MKLTNEQIIDSIGRIRGIGAEHVDNKIYKNLQGAIELVDLLVYEIIKASEDKDRPEQSMSNIGSLAYNSLLELIERLSEQLEQ